MKRMLAVALAAAAALLTVAAVSGSAEDNNGPRVTTIHVIEHATSDTVTNNTAAGVDTAGDLLTFANDVFNAANTRKVGTDQGYCIRIVVPKSWECNYTTFLPKGQIVVEGPFYDTADSKLAITGGTGAYRNARGWQKLSARSGGTEFDFVFHVIR